MNEGKLEARDVDGETTAGAGWGAKKGAVDARQAKGALCRTAWAKDESGRHEKSFKARHCCISARCIDWTHVPAQRERVVMQQWSLRQEPRLRRHPAAVAEGASR